MTMLTGFDEKSLQSKIVFNKEFSHDIFNKEFPHGLDRPTVGLKNHRKRSVKVVRALFGYTANNADELSFDEDDILYVLEDCGEWWKARCNGVTGLIPYNFVAESEELKYPLHDAVRRGNVAFLKDCLSQGVSSTSLDVVGGTPLLWAAYCGQTECLRILLEQDSPPLDVLNRLGEGPLHYAAARGHMDAVKLLVESGASLDLENETHETPEQVCLDSSIRNYLHLHRTRNGRKYVDRFRPADYDDDSSD